MNESSFPILSLLIFLPLLGAIMTGLCGNRVGRVSDSVTRHHEWGICWIMSGYATLTRPTKLDDKDSRHE